MKRHEGEVCGEVRGEYPGEYVAMANRAQSPCRRAFRDLWVSMVSTDVAAIEAVAEKLAAHPEIAKVVDPVMVATSGAKLIADDAVDALELGRDRVAVRWRDRHHYL